MHAPRFFVRTFLLVYVLLARAFAADTGPVHLGGCFFMADDGQRFLVPLESTEVVLEVKPGLMEAEVIQTFTNRTSTALEATYLYPLPGNATLTQFELRFRDRIVRSEVHEKQQAQQVYNTAKAEGRKAALLEQRDPSLFSTAVANFLPGETVHVVLRFIQPLELAADHVDVRFPMVTGQKYFPADTRYDIPGDAAPDPARRERDGLPHHVYAFDIAVSGFPVRAITSASHQIKVAPAADDPGRQLVALAEEITIPDRDFVLRIDTTTGSQPPQPTLVTQHTTTGDYGLLTLFPPTVLPGNTPPPPRDILFLIDHSGSMQGERMDRARKGLEQCLSFLTPRDRFRIVIFDSTFSSFRSGWSSGTPAEITDAKSYTRKIEARSGTELQPALAASLATFQDNDHEQVLILLTDGDVGNANSLLQLVESKLGRVRLFTMGIGQAPNATLLGKIAELGTGQARFIANDSDVEREMTDLYRTLSAPVLTNVRLSLVDADGAEVKYATFPENLPDVFVGRPIQNVFRWVQGTPAFAVVEGTAGNQRVRHRLPLSAGSPRGNGLEKEFGRRLYDDTANLLRRAQTESEQKLVREEMLATALQFQLVTELTSRVAVDEVISRDPAAPLASQHVAQYHPADSTMRVGASGDEFIQLDPFNVKADADIGFVAASSLAGGRISTALKDTPIAYSVITKEFIKAIGTIRLEDVAAHAIEPDHTAQPSRVGSSVAMLDGLPIATVVDPATVELISLQSMGPAATETTTAKAGRNEGLTTLRVGDQGFASVALRVGIAPANHDDRAGLGVFTWDRMPQSRFSGVFDGWKKFGEDSLCGTLQWRELTDYGRTQMARASFEHIFSESMGLKATLGWHELLRDHPTQFRLGSPAAGYDGLGFLNLDLLTSETRRLEDQIAQLEWFGSAEFGAFMQSWSARTRWHRQLSDWLTPFAGNPLAPRRDESAFDFSYRLTSVNNRQSITANAGWANLQTPGETLSRRGTSHASVGFEQSITRTWALFGTGNYEQAVPWTSTGAWWTGAPYPLSISAPVEQRIGGQAGLRVTGLLHSLEGTVALFHEQISGFTYRDWAWEQANPSPVGIGSTLRSGISTQAWPRFSREGWMGNLNFTPGRGLAARLTWYHDWRHDGPVRGNDTQASLAVRYESHGGPLSGFIVGHTLSYRSASVFNDGFTLAGGIRCDVMLGYRLRPGRSEMLLQLNAQNLGNRSWQPTRFATDRGRDLVFSVTKGF